MRQFRRTHARTWLAATTALLAVTGGLAACSPNPSGATFSRLSAVSCTSATSCFAVGRSYRSGSNYTLIERYA